MRPDLTMRRNSRQILYFLSPLSPCFKIRIPVGAFQASTCRWGFVWDFQNEHSLLLNLAQHLWRRNGDADGRPHNPAILQNLVHKPSD